MVKNVIFLISLPDPPIFNSLDLAELTLTFIRHIMTAAPILNVADRLHFRLTNTGEFNPIASGLSGLH